MRFIMDYFRDPTRSFHSFRRDLKTSTSVHSPLGALPLFAIYKSTIDTDID